VLLPRAVARPQPFRDLWATIFWGQVSVACTCCFVSLAERDLLYGVCCCCGQVACVLNNVTWQPLLECHHGTPVDEPPGVAVYQEVEEMRAVLAPVQVGGGWAGRVSEVWQLHSAALRVAVLACS
jgi:hypothetical protein